MRMSVRRARLGPLARNNARDILLCTGQRWGREQRATFPARIAGALRELGGFPLRGIARDDLFPGCRSLLVEQHRIYNRVTETEIIVSRIRHVSQDDVGAVITPVP